MLKFFETLLNMSITGAVIIAFVIIVRLFLKKLPRKYSYILWIIPAIRLIIPFSVAAPVSVFNFIHIPEQHAAVVEQGEVTEPPALTDDVFTDPVTDAVITDPITNPDDNFDNVPGGVISGEIGPQITGVPSYTAEVVTNAPSVTEPIGAPAIPDMPEEPEIPDTPDTPQAPVLTETSTAVTLWRAACAIWATGVIAMFCYLAYSFAATKRAVEFSYKIGEELYSNGHIETPFVFGYIKPRIYVPFGLDDKEFAYVVAHERTHIKRGDHIIKAIASLTLCVHWFNPFAWLAFKLMTVDMELSCDERALNTYELDARKDYARTLLNMSVVGGKMPFHGMLSFGESSIKSRIKGILRMKKPAAWACVLAACAIIVCAVCLLTNAEQTPPDPVGTDTTDPAETTDPVDTDEPPVTDDPVTTDAPVTTDPIETADGKEYNAAGDLIKETITETVDGKTHKTVHFYSYYTSNDPIDHITYFYVNDGLQYIRKQFYYTAPSDALYMESMQYYNDDGSEGEYTFKRYSEGGILIKERYYENGKAVEKQYVYKDGVQSLIYTLEDAVKYWLATDSSVASPAKGGRNENQYSNLVIEYDPEYANDIAAQFKQGDVAEQHGITKDCDVQVVNAKFSGGGFSDNSILVVVVKGADGIFRGVSEVRVVQQTETGGVAMIGALSTDGTLREHTIFSGGFSYSTFMLPSSLDVEIGDKVKVTYLRFAAMKAQLGVKVLSAECLEDKSVPVTMEQYTTKLPIQNSDDPKVPVNYSVPSNWQNYGMVFNRNNVPFFRVEDVVYAVENGIDVEGLKNYAQPNVHETTVLEEKRGTADDPFAYYVYVSIPEEHGCDGTNDLHRYVVEDNGYYVTVGFFGDAEIPAETVDAVLRSIKVGTPWDDASVSFSPEGNIIYVRLSGGELYVNVVDFSAENVDYLQKILQEYSYIPQNVITFPNKDVNFVYSPAVISRKTEKFVLYNTCLNYTVVDGAIYTKDMETLVAFPPAVTGEYTLPNSVKYIDDYAFYGSKLTKLNIPASIERIGALNGAEGVEVKLVKSEMEEYNVWGELIKKTVVESVDGKLHKYVNTFTYEITHIDETYFYIDGVLQYRYERISYTGSRDRIRSETTKYYNADGTVREYTAKNYDGEGRVVSETYYENGKPVKKEYVYPDGITQSLIYTVEDAVKYWLGNRSFYTVPEKGGVNPHRYSDLVIEYEYEYADEIREMYEDPAVAEAYGYEQGSSVTVVKAYFTGGRISGDAFIPVVIVKNKDGIYSPIDEVSVSTRTVTGVISKVAEVKEDETLKEYTVSSSAVFVLSASLDWQPCDKVSLSYTGFRGSSIIYPSEIVATSNIYTNIEKLADAPSAAGIAEHEFSASETTDSSVTIKVSVSLPSDWVVSGSAAARSGLRHFAFINKVTPSEYGVDIESMRIYNSSPLTVVSEKKGTENDLYAYYVYAESPNVTDWKVTKYIHRYAVLSNGYYVYIDFNADVGIASETLEAVLKSVNAGSKWDETVISVSPPGNIIYVRIGNGELYVNVEELTAENVDYLHAFVYDEYSYMKQNSITFPNKELVLTANPNLISEKTEKYEIYSLSNNYVSVDGAIYTKDMETLVAFPPARTGEYTLPDSVKRIDDYALYGSKLTKLFVPIDVDKGRLIGVEGVAVEEKTTEVKGTVIDVGELTADGTRRYFLVRDGGLIQYRFTAPADSTIKVGDLVTVVFAGEVQKGRNGENNTLSVISHEDPNETVTAVKHSFSLTVKNSPSLAHVNVDIEFPSDWERGGTGTVLSRNGVKFFELSSAIAPYAMGIDETIFKASAETEVTVIEERYGIDGDPYAYYIYHSRPPGDKYGPDATYDVHSYVVLSNGYYVTLGFLGDADIEQDVIDRVLRSVDVFADANGYNDGEIFGELFGDIRYMAIKYGTLTLDVVTLDEATVEHIKAFVDKYPEGTVTGIAFTNKNLSITCSPTRISERVLSFTVPENCIGYVTVDGVIYSKDSKVLIAMPPARAGTYSLPNSVEKMDDHALFGSKLNSLTIPALLNDRGALIGADNVKIYQK